MSTKATEKMLGIDELVKADRVHRDLYTDPSIFEKEMEIIFEKTWVFVGHESEVPHPGDYKTVYIGRQPAIMSRHRDGKIYVLLNRCMHRGAVVCREEKGNSSTFRCLYHGWSYNNCGELIGVPYRKGYGEGFDVSEYALLRAPRVASYRGFIFASLSSEGKSLEDHLGHIRYHLDLICDSSPEGEIEFGAGVQKYIVPANWKIQLENLVDGYHAGFTHEVTFEIVGKKGAVINVRDGNGAKALSYPNGHGALDYTGQRVGYWFAMAQRFPDYKNKLEKIRGKERAQELLEKDTQFIVFPNLFSQRDYQHIRVIRPISVDKTEVYAYPYKLKGAPDELNNGGIIRLGWWVSAGGFGQPDDVEAFACVQEGLRVTDAEWIMMNRGIHREQYEADGVIVGDSTDEVPQRGLYREWKRLMTMGTTH